MSEPLTPQLLQPQPLPPQPTPVVEQLPEPPPLRLAVFAYMDNLAGREDLAEECAHADLVVALGGIDLNELAQLIPPRKRAVCVLGPRDGTAVPAPFQLLHANGRMFRGWRLAGLSGGPLRALGGLGHFVSEEDAATLLDPLPASDMFFTHAPPSGLDELDATGLRSEQGLISILEYIESKAPIYHFYAHPQETVVHEHGETLTIGVNGHLQTPALRFV